MNPNYTAHALDEIERCVERGAIGIKLRPAAAPTIRCSIRSPTRPRGAGFRAAPHLAAPHARVAGQEISDGADLGRLAQRHPRASFILAHIGGGGD